MVVGPIVSLLNFGGSLFVISLGSPLSFRRVSWFSHPEEVPYSVILRCYGHYSYNTSFLFYA